MAQISSGSSENKTSDIHIYVYIYNKTLNILKSNDSCTCIFICLSFSSIIALLDLGN